MLRVLRVIAQSYGNIDECFRELKIASPCSFSGIVNDLRTFALIVSAHPYCARKFTPRRGYARAR